MTSGISNMDSVIGTQNSDVNKMMSYSRS